METPDEASVRVVYTVPEVARMLGISRNQGYELARTGRIPTIRLGKRLIVPKVAFERMMEVTLAPPID